MKKKLLVLVLALAMLTTGTIAVLANPTSGQGDIEFRDTRPPRIDIDPDPDDPYFPELPEDEDWDAILDAEGLDFWDHDLLNIYNHAPATVRFNTVRASNAVPGGGPQWDPDSVTLAGQAQVSYTGVIAQPFAHANMTVTVRAGGFFTDPLNRIPLNHILRGYNMTLNRSEFVQYPAGATGNVFNTSVPNLMAGADGALGGSVMVAPTLIPNTRAGANYTAELAVARAQALAAPVGAAQAELVWTIGLTP